MNDVDDDDDTSSGQSQAVSCAEMGSEADRERDPVNSEMDDNFRLIWLVGTSEMH